MSSFNRVVLMGNVTRDPEMRFLPSGAGVCKFGMAMNRKYKSGEEWKEDVCFVDVTMFGPRAEPFAKYHAKGAKALVEGELRLDTWEDKNGGGKRTKLYVVATGWEFVGGKEGGKREDGPAVAHPETTLDGADDTPW